MHFVVHPFNDTFVLCFVCRIRNKRKSISNTAFEHVLSARFLLSSFFLFGHNNSEHLYRGMKCAIDRALKTYKISARSTVINIYVFRTESVWILFTHIKIIFLYLYVCWLGAEVLSVAICIYYYFDRTFHQTGRVLKLVACNINRFIRIHINLAVVR